MESVLVTRTCNLCDLMRKINQGEATEDEINEFQNRKEELKKKLKTKNKVQTRKT